MSASRRQRRRSPGMRASERRCESRWRMSKRRSAGLFSAGGWQKNVRRTVTLSERGSAKRRRRRRRRSRLRRRRTQTMDQSITRQSVQAGARRCRHLWRRSGRRIAARSERGSAQRQRPRPRRSHRRRRRTRRRLCESRSPESERLNAERFVTGWSRRTTTRSLPPRPRARLARSDTRRAMPAWTVGRRSLPRAHRAQLRRVPWPSP